MSSILTNNGAMVALQTLTGINKEMGDVQSQVSTGKKVASASDNSAVWAISSVMESDVEGFKAVSESLSLGASTVAVARSASESVTELLTEMKGKIISAQESNVDRDKIQTDVSALRDQVTAIVDAAQFNGLNLLKGNANVEVLASLDRDDAGNVTTSSITVSRNSLEQTAGVAVGGAFDGTSTTGVNGTGDSAAALVADGNTFALDFDSGNTPVADQVYSVTIGSKKVDYIAQTGDTHDDLGQGLANAINEANISGVTVAFAAGGAGVDAQLDITNGTGEALAITAEATDGAGGGLANLAGLDVTNDTNAAAALADIEGLIQTSVDAAASFGSVEKRIDIQSDFISKLTDNFKSGIGSLVDANLEQVSARLQSLQVQQQLSSQALSIANQAPQSVLSLFR